MLTVALQFASAPPTFWCPGLEACLLEIVTSFSSVFHSNLTPAYVIVSQNLLLYPCALELVEVLPFVVCFIFLKEKEGHDMHFP